MNMHLVLKVLQAIALCASIARAILDIVVEVREMRQDHKRDNG